MQILKYLQGVLGRDRTSEGSFPELSRSYLAVVEDEEVEFLQIGDHLLGKLEETVPAVLIQYFIS